MNINLDIVLYLDLLILGWQVYDSVIVCSCWIGMNVWVGVNSVSECSGWSVGRLFFLRTWVSHYKYTLHQTWLARKSLIQMEISGIFWSKLPRGDVPRHVTRWKYVTFFVPDLILWNRTRAKHLNWRGDSLASIADAPMLMIVQEKESAGKRGTWKPLDFKTPTYFLK